MTLKEKKLSYYLTKAKDTDDITFEKVIKIAILGSFTLNGLEETFCVKCAEKKIKCSTYVSGYNQYNQDILNTESALYKFLPDVTFLVLDTRSILGKFFYSPYSFSTSQRKEFVKQIINDITNLVQTFIKKSNSKFIISNFPIPNYSPYGIIETKAEYGLQEMVRDVNANLASIVADKPSVYLYDFNGFVTRYGEVNVFDYRQFFFGDIKVALDYIPYLVNDFMSYVKAMLGLNRKCIVLDLDNTLWGGIVGEDGLNGIILNPNPPGNAFIEFQHHLLALWKRGIILAINSKNNFEDAIEVIREHPYMVLHEENFASLKINWDDKISNMKEIARELNIGLDSLVYFDDDPANRELIIKYLPEVLTVDLPDDPSQYSPILMDINDFNVLKITEEDLKRGEMYLQEKKRTDFEKTVTNVEDFLKQLDIKIKIKKADEFTIPRISQLTLKTNQFNLTTFRYQEEDIRNFAHDKNMLVGCAQVEDKFGNNGITGVFIVKKERGDEWVLDTFLLSCRVMGKRVEDGIIGYILEKAKKDGVKRLKGKYLPTRKNKPCKEFLPSCGFKKEGEYWIYDLDSKIEIPSHLEVIVE